MISRMNRFRFLLLPLALVSLATAQEEKLPNATELLNKAEPHLLKTNGEKATLKPELRKKHTLIYWSAGWCGPCRKFTPEHQVLQRARWRQRVRDHHGQRRQG